MRSASLIGCSVSVVVIIQYLAAFGNEILEHIAIRDAFEDRVALTGQPAWPDDDLDWRLHGDSLDVIVGRGADDDPVWSPHLASKFIDDLGEQPWPSNGREADGEVQQQFP